MKKLFLLFLLYSPFILGQGNTIPGRVDTLETKVSDMVTKSTSQTITGQKNFSGTVKIGDDSSWSFEKNTINQLVKTIPNSSARRRWLRFPIADDGWHDEFALQLFASPNVGTGVAPNYVMRLGYNPNQTDVNRASWTLNWESYWQPADTTDRWSEWYLEYFHPITGVTTRPYSAVVSWVDNYTQVGMVSDEYSLTDRVESKPVLLYVHDGSLNEGFPAGKKQLMFGGTTSSGIVNNLQYRWFLPKDSSVFFINNYEFLRMADGVYGTNNAAIFLPEIYKPTIYIGGTGNSSSLQITLASVGGDAQSEIKSEENLSLKARSVFIQNPDNDHYFYFTADTLVDGSSIAGLSTEGDGVLTGQSNLVMNVNGERIYIPYSQTDTLFIDDWSSKDRFIPLLNMTVDDTLPIWYPSKYTEIDSIAYKTDDSLAIQIEFGSNGTGTNVLTAIDTLIGKGTITSFNEYSISSFNEVQMYFPYAGDTYMKAWLNIYYHDTQVTSILAGGEWENGVAEPLETFSAVRDRAITAANTSDDGNCWLGSFNVTTGEVYRARFFLKLNSGTLPNRFFFRTTKDGGTGCSNLIQNCREGWNVMDFTITETLATGFWVGIIGATTDFEITNFTIELVQ